MMVNSKLAKFYIMLAIFLFSIAVGCESNQSTLQQTTTPTETPAQRPISDQELKVTISYPTDRSSVSFNEPVSGNSTGVYGSGLHLYLLVNPAANISMWWIQPEANLSSDGSWQVNAHFGRSSQQDIGSKFWVKVVVTSDNLTVGKSSYPSGVIYSTKKILLTRI